MPLKDDKIKAAIKQVLGTSRKGRNKVIKLVRKKNPEYSHSQIRRMHCLTEERSVLSILWIILIVNALGLRSVLIFLPGS